MKSIVSISFLLGSLVSTISSTSVGTVTLTALTSHEPENYVDITVPFGVFRPLETPVQAFHTWFKNVQDTTPGVEGIGCLLFKDAAGTDALKPIFGLSDQSGEDKHPSVPEQIGSLICLNADDPRLHVKSARKSRRVIHGRTVQDPPELVDGIESIYESATGAWKEPDLPGALAEHAQSVARSGGRFPLNPEQDEKPAAEPFYQPSTGGIVYPDNYVIPHQEEWPTI